MQQRRRRIVGAGEQEENEEEEKDIEEDEEEEEEEDDEEDCDHRVSFFALCEALDRLCRLTSAPTSRLLGCLTYCFLS